MRNSKQSYRLNSWMKSSRTVRFRAVSIRPSAEQLEVRAVPSLTWTTLGEGSVAGNVVTMGVANRGEFDQQPIDFHGAYAQLPAARHYEIAFDYNLSTWDSYNADEQDGGGYWDSFSVSITSTPYPQLNVLTDPLQFPFVWGGNSWTDGILEQTSGMKVITADFNVATPRYLNVVLDTKTLPTADNNYPSWGTITIITGDLGMVENDGTTEVPDNQQQSPGGYVALNNEDADYNGTPDFMQAGPIMGEADLVPLKIHKIDPVAEGGTYTLMNLSPNLKIWTSPDKTGPVDPTTTFDATQDTTVYVEGIGESSGKAKEEIDLKWTNGTISAMLDSVKYTVYKVTGPADVPDDSIMTYKGDIPGGATGNWTATGGTIKTGANTNTSTILWGSGPANGKATFTASPGFSVDYAVNVVQVKIDPPTVGNTFTAGTPTFQGSGAIAGAALGVVISSGNPGIQWNAKITLNGPSANGIDQRGVTHIEVGFVQNVTFSVYRGDYLVSGATKSLTANLQGHSYHDSDPGDVYYDNGATYVFKPTATDAASRTKSLSGNDSPSNGVPVYFKKGTALAPPNDGTLTSMHLNSAFTLWITARTDDTDNGANLIYTNRGVANWSFVVNENYPFASPLTGSSVTVPAGWTPVTDGSQPNLTGGQTANQALASKTYS